MERFPLPRLYRLAVALFAHGMLRIASGASGVLIGIYLADLHIHGYPANAALLGALSAASYAGEIAASIPFGMAADSVSPRWLMAAGALTGALAVQLFALNTHSETFFLSRVLEGIGAAAVTPPLLAYLAESSMHDAGLRARLMSFFELSLLAGLALGGLTGSEFWRHFHLRAFSLIALAYLLCALLLLAGVSSGTRSPSQEQAFGGLLPALKNPGVRALAPVWLCVNAIVGLWLGPTLPFLLTNRPSGRQFLDGMFAANPAGVGWLLLGYAMVFGAGVTAWSFVLPHVQIRSAMRVALLAMLPVCLGLFFLNHSSAMTPPVRVSLVAAIALLIMLESGFTPAALAWLAQSLGTGRKGAPMGIYSVLLSLGAIGGSLLAGALGEVLQIDGLLLGTAALGVGALVLLRNVKPLAEPME